jgi:hypothetical protein
MTVKISGPVRMPGAPASVTWRVEIDGVRHLLAWSVVGGGHIVMSHEEAPAARPPQTLDDPDVRPPRWSEPLRLAAPWSPQSTVTEADAAVRAWAQSRQ